MDLITETTKESIKIVEMHNKEVDNGLLCNITIRIKNKDELEHFKNQISKYKGIKVL
jgi:hypothetical protein